MIYAVPKIVYLELKYQGVADLFRHFLYIGRFAY